MLHVRDIYLVFSFQNFIIFLRIIFKIRFQFLKLDAAFS